MFVDEAICKEFGVKKTKFQMASTTTFQGANHKMVALVNALMELEADFSVTGMQVSIKNESLEEIGMHFIHGA